MNRQILTVLFSAASLVACSAIGQLTVKDYTAPGGERVMAGQAEPKDEYQCRKISQEEQDWGLTGNMDKSAAMERITQVAIETAPAKGANYAYVIAPAEVGVLGFNVNAFAGAEVAYYHCKSLPPAGS